MDFITIKAACRVVGGEERPIHPATYYRGVRAGRYPPPIHVSPGLSRISLSQLLAKLGQLAELGEDK